MPIVDVFLRHNPFLMFLERHDWISSATFPGALFAIKHMQARRKQSADRQPHADRREDLLDKFLNANITDAQVLGLSLSMMIAGSETT